MTTTQEFYVEASRRADEIITTLAYFTVEAGRALANAARGQGVGEDQVAAVDPGPATIMIGGLTTMVTILSLFMARRSLGSEPEPVNTRASKRKADEAVDVYLDGSSSSDEAASASDSAASNGGSESGSSNGGTESVSSSGGPPPSSGEGPWTTTTTGAAGQDDAASPGRTNDPSRAPQAGAEELVEVEQTQAQAAVHAESGPVADADGNHEFARGCRAGKGVEAEDPDEVLGCLEAAELGTPSIVQSTPNLIVVRLEGCRGCRSPTHHEEDHGRQQGCPFEAGFLEGAMGQVLPDGAVVRETACRRGGDEACDFEVWY